MSGLNVGLDEIRFGGKVVVQAHLRHPGLRGDPVNAGGVDAVRIEPLSGCVEDPVTSRRFPGCRV